MRMCRVCGCTEDQPCVTAGGETCAWIADDLCDFCDIEASDRDLPLVELCTEGDLNRVIAERRRAATA